MVLHYVQLRKKFPADMNRQRNFLTQAALDRKASLLIMKYSFRHLRKLNWRYLNSKTTKLQVQRTLLPNASKKPQKILKLRARSTTQYAASGNRVCDLHQRLPLYTLPYTRKMTKVFAATTVILP